MSHSWNLSLVSNSILLILISIIRICVVVYRLETYYLCHFLLLLWMLFYFKNSLHKVLFSPPCGSKVWTQGLVPDRKALYHLSHTHSPFCFSFFSRQGLMFLHRLVSNLNPPTCTWDYRIHYHAQLRLVFVAAVVQGGP
jgi:hypothetical protein